MNNKPINRPGRIATMSITATMLVAAMAYTAPSASAQTAAFYRDLAIGSTGADVVSLQQWLIGKGYSIPAGATGMYGAQTRSAVAAYQAANGIAPAAGYFGPTTRATVNASIAKPQEPKPNPEKPVFNGQEGELRNIDQLGDTETEVQESETDVQILGIEFEAEDSDMTIERVDVVFDKNSGDGSNRLNRYIDSVHLTLDGKEIASMSVSKANRDGSEHTFRFTGLKGVVKEGRTAELYVTVDAADNLDSEDMDDTWTVTIPEDGIRARDGAGISETYVSSDISETIDFARAEQGALDITAANNNPEDSVIIVSDTRDTSDVTLLSFELEADNQDIEIEDIPVSLAVTGNAANLGDVVKTVKLMRGSKVIKSKNIPANAGTYEEVLFTKVNQTIEAGDTETYTVVADIRKMTGSFHAGDAITASTTSQLSGWDMEDANGDDVSPSGTAEGNTMTFFTNGIDAKVVSVSERKSLAADQTGEADIGEYKITFDVEALEEDVYLDRSVTRGTAGTAGNGFMWATTTDTTADNTALVAMVSSTKTDAGDTADLFRIRKGDTRRFTLTVDLEATSSGVAGIMLTGNNWTTDRTDTTPDNFHTVNFTNFVTGLQSLYKF